MRHLHFVQSLEPLQGGGLGLAALQLHLEMRKSGRSRLLTSRSTPFNHEWPDVLQGMRRGPEKFYYSPEIAAAASLEVSAADWVQGHGLYTACNWLIGRELRRQGKPLVYHLHGFFDPWILGRSRWKKRLAHFLFENANFSAVKFWRVLTSKEADQTRAYGLRQPVEILPNGIDLADGDISSFPPASIHLHLNKVRSKRLLFLSRIHPKKGLDLLIPAWGRLAVEFPDWELVLVGPDEGGYQFLVEKMIRETGTEDSCRIFPSVFGEEKHAVFRTADAFVLPSHSEGFPMSILEAAAHSLPVIQTTECNFPELSACGGAWECLPTVEDLHHTLHLALSADDSERTQRGKLGRELIESRYTWKKIAASLEAACEAHA